MVAAAIVVVAAVIVGLFVRKGGGPVGPGEEKTGGEVTIPGPGGEEMTVFNPEVPENAEPTPPVAEAPAAQGAEEKWRRLEITMSSAGFEPNEITVNKGDVVQIRLTAQGGDYDIQIPYTGHYAKVSNGETKEISLGVNTVGKYTFSCRDYCPAGKVISGSLIVLP